MTDIRIACLLVLAAGGASLNAGADSSLGEINIELRGNVVDYSCYVETGSDSKTVQLGTWPTKQLSTVGSTTQSMPFTLKLNGCPPGSASITFSGKTASGNPALLALNGTSSAKNVAVQLRDKDKTQLPLEQASQDVAVDAQGNATLTFYANYIALADNPQPGKADADATFMINYY
ncbi:fimbria assembly protein [Enterobacteriaceae bacterium H11S18]|uniref:fimbria assembly protein n=1 Tax=Dryocola clanedunensis TaxID=2925396 RepID=UPI0022F07374|nr:fimbria assembly protein [Dryocola clanedunensis]MCT4705374.1 fimbria assembly protein [Dryocola clanedunensis]MCT4709746.1 fimbria assembly protein [Dryocola clanedunensis]